MIILKKSRGFTPYFLIIFGFIAFFTLINEPETLSYVTARADKVVTKVTSPEMMRQQAQFFNIKGELEVTQLGFKPTGKPPQLICTAGLIEPTEGTKVTYRYQFNKLTITIERDDSKPAALFKGFAENLSPALLKSSFLTFEPGDCKQQDTFRLPLFGAVEIGDEQRVVSHAENPPSNPLLEGRIIVYGQSLNIPYLSQYLKKSLYFSQELEIPMGARLYEPKTMKQSTNWSGFVSLYKDDVEAGLKVDTTTNARTLALQIAGGKTEPFFISISNISQIMNDPNILNLQLFGLTIVFIFQLIGTLFTNRNT